MTPAGTTPIAVAQFAPTADIIANLTTIEELVATASARSARLVVFPEYSSYFVDPFDSSLAEHAQDIDRHSRHGAHGSSRARRATSRR